MYQLFEQRFSKCCPIKTRVSSKYMGNSIHGFLDSIDCWCVRSLVVLACQYWPQWCFEKSTPYSILEKIINVCRSIPFIIMLALIQPLTRILAGTTIGTTAAVSPISYWCIRFLRAPN